MNAPYLANTAPHELLGTLLTDVAHKIQLSPTDYGIAVDRYETIEKWLLRDDSGLKHVLKRIYPQGSIAIGATIASKMRNDEFDVDVIAELDLPDNSPPAEVLDALFDAINGEKGTRYHGRAIRRTRCVTLQYDNMHIDVTPSILRPQLPSRTSFIFHAHEDEQAEKHKTITANPWGFAQWFIEQTPDVREIVEAFVRKSSDPVPDQESIRDKSNALLALQLLKRWRNKNYDSRAGRSPPSIILAHMVGSSNQQPQGLFATLLANARNIKKIFSELQSDGQLVHVENPTCQSDVLSDRWPADLETQKVFLDDLVDLIAKLEALEARPTLKNTNEIFSDLFGERVTRLVIEDYQERYREKSNAGELMHNNAGLALGASGLSSTGAIASSTAKPIKRHTDFGS